ncbi:alpha-taxilin-like isoform X2 [Ornithodoros turicata]|uniref:alpha-taxilin-like isoform X2 n=1 Tax=Ornithodoros turicata TaxID=34597 RepID=UPI003139597B
MESQIQNGLENLLSEQHNGEISGMENAEINENSEGLAGPLEVCVAADHCKEEKIENVAAIMTQGAIAEKQLEKLASGIPQDGSLERIISECNSAAQQMKHTIHEVLKARLEMGEAAAQEESPEEDLIKRLVHLRQVIQKNVGEDTSSHPKHPSSGDNSDNLSAAAVDRAAREPSPKCSTPQRTSASAEKGHKEKSTSVAECCAAEKPQGPHEEAAVKGPAQPKATSVPPCERRESPLRKMPAKHTSATSKRKGEKTVESIMRGLAAHMTPEAKLEALCQQHLGALEAMRLLQLRVQQADRTAAQAVREKEQLQGECNRALLARSRLEGLCRELQRQGRVIKEESALRIREEEEKRKEVAGKFQVALQDITALLQDNQARSMQLRKENTELVQKLKTLVDHYEMWEKHMGTMLEQKELQAQVARAKQVRTEAQLHQERQAFLQEKQQVLQRVSDTQRHTEQLAANEAQLRAELALYTSKYQEFQGALSQSNHVFRTFKADMEQMSKKIKKLEKETLQWKNRWESSNKALAEMAADKDKRDQELVAAQQRVITLEKLCRALQLERNELNKKLGDTATTLQGIGEVRGISGTNVVESEAS